MGASCLTGIITCQIRKENPDQTLPDFHPDSYVVHPRPDLRFEILQGYRIIDVCLVT